MKAEEIRKLTLEEINKKVVECKDELFRLRMQQSNGMLRETHKINELIMQCCWHGGVSL